MIISANNIKNKLDNHFPNLIDWEPADREFVTINQDWLYQTLLNYHRFSDPIKGVWECEEIANDFISDDRKNQVKNINNLPIELKTRNRAIGRLSGNRFRHVVFHHVINFAVSDTDILLFDIMLPGEIWTPTKQDQVFWAVML